MGRALARALTILGAIGIAMAWFGCDERRSVPQVEQSPVTAASSPEDPPMTGVGGAGAAGESTAGETAVVPATEPGGGQTGTFIPGSGPTELPDGTSKGAVGAPTTGNEGSKDPGRNQGDGYRIQPRPGAVDIDPAVEPSPELRDEATGRFDQGR